MKNHCCNSWSIEKLKQFQKESIARFWNFWEFDFVNRNMFKYFPINLAKCNANKICILLTHIFLKYANAIFYFLSRMLIEFLIFRKPSGMRKPKLMNIFLLRKSISEIELYVHCFFALYQSQLHCCQTDMNWINEFSCWSNMFPLPVVSVYFSLTNP